jgi:hypothetical protein
VCPFWRIRDITPKTRECVFCTKPLSFDRSIIDTYRAEEDIKYIPPLIRKRKKRRTESQLKELKEKNEPKEKNEKIPKERKKRSPNKIPRVRTTIQERRQKIEKKQRIRVKQEKKRLEYEKIKELQRYYNLIP